MTAFLDTNIIVRHFTGDPPDQARLAARYLDEADQLLLPDLILAEVAYVLQSYYRMSRDQVAAALRSTLAIPAVQVADRGLLQRTVELYDFQRLDFADAYLVASAESTGVNAVASFDRDLDRVGTVRREEPA
ncbi:MAG: type II toxin-antitoxin system VapC family toxin [Chloroflexi bacterium]|nr:type II toxin-antitoxin system VapC family toxin [Chloroflexota bacterium]